MTTPRIQDLIPGFTVLERLSLSLSVIGLEGDMMDGGELGQLETIVKTSGFTNELGYDVVTGCGCRTITTTLPGSPSMIHQNTCWFHEISVPARRKVVERMVAYRAYLQHRYGENPGKRDVPKDQEEQSV